MINLFSFLIRYSTGGTVGPRPPTGQLQLGKLHLPGHAAQYRQDRLRIQRGSFCMFISSCLIFYFLPCLSPFLSLSVFIPTLSQVVMLVYKFLNVSAHCFQTKQRRWSPFLCTACLKVTSTQTLYGSLLCLCTYYHSLAQFCWTHFIILSLKLYLLLNTKHALAHYFLCEKIWSLKGLDEQCDKIVTVFLEAIVQYVKVPDFNFHCAYVKKKKKNMTHFTLFLTHTAPVVCFLDVSKSFKIFSLLLFLKVLHITSFLLLEKSHVCIDYAEQKKMGFLFVLFLSYLEFKFLDNCP